jgi:DNA-binding CsgD family transcriptional regulator
MRPKITEHKQLTRRSLTDREREIIIFLADGKSREEIAEALKISPYAIDGHKSRIMLKLGINNQADLIRYAIGLIVGKNKKGTHNIA